MSQSETLFRKIIPAAVFIILEIAAVSILKSSSSIQNIWINRLSHSLHAVTWGLGEKANQYFSLRSQNDQLAKENFILTTELNKYKEFVSEDQMSSFFEGRKSDSFSYTPATIVKLSRNTQHNYIIIDKGSEDGILPHSGIITSNGVVGIIEAVDKHYSYGISFQNTKMSLSARIGKSGFVNAISWDGISSNKAQMIDIPHYINVEPGDTLWTSGFSNIFPGDIMLGTVEDVRKKGGARVAKISLFQDFSSLRYVTVVSNSAEGEIEDLENKVKNL